MMNTPQIGKGLAIAAITMFAAGSAFAANDGSLGATSQGDLEIFLTIDSLVQISDLNDITLPDYTTTGDLSGADNVCVFSNNGGYDITATGSGAASAFVLAGSTTPPVTIPYTVQWATSSDASSGTTLDTGTPLTGQGGTFTTPNCDDNTNATVIVTVADADLAPAPADDYSGVLTLLVAPQ